MMKSQPIKSSGLAHKAIEKEQVSNNSWIGRAHIQDFVEEVENERGEKENRVVDGMKTWVEQMFDHEPTQKELEELPVL